jgi:protein-S-isoprenylcysteine O-methyltransferase Ste14
LGNRSRSHLKRKRSLQQVYIREYIFLDLLLAAIVVAIDWPMLLLAWVTIIVVQVIQSRREEKVLAIAFGAEYEAYTRQTWI